MKKKTTQAADRSPAERQGCSATALLLVDVINDFDFPAAPKLLRYARPAAGKISRLKRRLSAAGIPVIYVNDNFGRWQSDFRAQVEYCSGEKARGSDLVRQLLPSEKDYFVLKPKHSGFYSTSLEVLLGTLGIERLIITGFAADICVLFTANDAYMRDFALSIPPDCVASESASASRWACRQMGRFLKADLRVSTAIHVEEL